MGTELFLIDSGNEVLKVYEDKLTLKPKGVGGFMLKGLKGEKVIPFHSITSIQHKEAGLLAGYLQFSVKGGMEAVDGLFGAIADENTFVFYKKHNEEIQKIKIHIQNNLMQGEPKETNIHSNISNSKADELKKLHELKTEGVITEDEFENEKEKLLAS